MLSYDDRFSPVGLRRPAHVSCQVFDGFPVGNVDGLSRMNVETGVVVPGHQ